MSFSDFWSVFPKRVEKIYAESCYKKALINGATEEEIFEGAKNYASDCLSNNRERQYIKNPSSWLNKGCWADDYDIPQATIQDPQETRWKARIKGFENTGSWLAEWGPDPTNSGCMAPKHLLKSNVISLRRCS